VYLYDSNNTGVLTNPFTIVLLAGWNTIPMEFQTGLVINPQGPTGNCFVL